MTTSPSAIIVPLPTVTQVRALVLHVGAEVRSRLDDVGQVVSEPAQVAGRCRSCRRRAPSGASDVGQPGDHPVDRRSGSRTGDRPGRARWPGGAAGGRSATTSSPRSEGAEVEHDGTDQRRRGRTSSRRGRAVPGSSSSPSWGNTITSRARPPIATGSVTASEVQQLQRGCRRPAADVPQSAGSTARKSTSVRAAGEPCQRSPAGTDWPACSEERWPELGAVAHRRVDVEHGRLADEHVAAQRDPAGPDHAVVGPVAGDQGVLADRPCRRRWSAGRCRRAPAWRRRRRRGRSWRRAPAGRGRTAVNRRRTGPAD